MVYWVYKRVYLRVYQCLPQYHQLLFPINIHENYIHIYIYIWMYPPGTIYIYRYKL